MNRPAVFLVIFILTGCGSQEPLPEEVHVDWKSEFKSSVAPLLQKKCLECHSGESAESGIRLDSLDVILEQKLIAPGDAVGSLLAHVVSGTDPIMPPGKTTLSKREVSTLESWIGTTPESAIPRPPEASTHWAWKPLERPEMPSSSSNWGRNGIDCFVARKLEAEDLQPSAEADRETLARRLSLAITGLPPDLAVLDSFLKRHEPDATDWLIEHLLASKSYGEHWGRYWLDAARYADSNGYHRDQERPMWMYRDWVIEAFNENMRFNDFTIRQLAGDLMPGARLSDRIATGFHRNTMLNQEGGANEVEFRTRAIADRVETTATIWLGATMHCARCHNHPNEPFTQTEFYELFAFFNNTKDKGSDRFWLPFPMYISGTKEQENQLKGWWKEIYERVEQVNRNKSTFESDPELMRLIAKHKELVLDIQSSLIMDELETPRDTFVHRRGDPTQPGPRVLPAVPLLFGNWPASLPRNRLGLAKWLVSPANPTTPRVTVNRIWQRLFGTGLVRTSDDFGTAGEEPSHPELLDWLAVEFVESGWNVKSLIRLIVNSATFRQSSNLTYQHISRDPENRLLARGPRFRMDAEVVRDTVLYVSGLLNTQIGGRSVFPPQPAGLWDDHEITDGETLMKWQESVGNDRYRRGLYTFWRRSIPYPMFTIFDAPNRETCTIRRDRTNTPLQALAGMNDPTFVAATIALAERMQKESDGSMTSGIELGYRLCVARRPTEVEVQILSDLWQSELARSIPAVPDDGPVPAPSGQSLNEDLAWRVVAGVLLNMHSTLTQW